MFDEILPLLDAIEQRLSVIEQRLGITAESQPDDEGQAPGNVRPSS